MINQDEYLNKLLNEINNAKTKNKNGVYKIREKIPDSVALYAKKYLEANTKFRIEFRKCPACTHEWDILIIF